MRPAVSFIAFILFAILSLSGPIFSTAELLPLPPTDTVWKHENSIIELVHSTNLNCSDSTTCPTCWTVSYEFPLDAPPTQLPRALYFSIHDLIGVPYTKQFLTPTGTIKTEPFPLELTYKSRYTMAIQASVMFPGNYVQSEGFNAKFTISPSSECPGSHPTHDQAPLEIPLSVKSPNETRRKEISSYFFNTYVPGTGDVSPPGLDPTKSHAELQTSAWYNWEMIPLPENDLDKPNMLDLRLYGTSYFVIDETYSINPTTTLCWINSLPVLLEIDTQTNQTLHIYAQPQFDMHNPKAVMKQPIPMASSTVDFFSSRFFFEFTCQDRLKIIYDPQLVRKDLMVFILGRYDHENDTFTYRNDRFPQPLSRLEDYVHGPTPEEALGRALYNPTKNLFMCRTTIDFHQVYWLDETSGKDLSIVVGIDGVTYTPDPEGSNTQSSSALLSILPDSDLYHDINPNFKSSDLKPLLYLSKVSSTGVGGPYIGFKLPTMRPYADHVHPTPSPRVQINILFQVKDPVFTAPEPSCTIIMDNIRAKDSVLSYATSQYMNATTIYEAQKKKKGEFVVQEEEEDAANPHEVELESDNNSWQSYLENILNSQIDQYFSPKSFSSSPLPTPEPSPSSSALIPSEFLPQGWDYPISTDADTGITVQSMPFKDLELHIQNPKHIDFDYISVNTIPGLTRFIFSSSLKNVISPDDDDDDDGHHQHDSTHTNELSSNGEQYIIDCHYAHNKELKLQGAVSIYARELQIGPINNVVIHDRNEFKIKCPGVSITEELHGFIYDYDYRTEVILTEDYSREATYKQLKMKKWEHFLTFFTIHHDDITTHQIKPQQSSKIADTNVSNKIAIISSLMQAQNKNDQNPSQFNAQQQPAPSQVYLNKVTGFSINEPDRTYTAVIFGVVFSILALIAIAILALPVRRYLETKKENKRHAAIRIEEIGMNTTPFAELGEYGDEEEKEEED